MQDQVFISPALAPKKILPTYQMLVDSAKPPLPEDAKALALEVAKDPKGFDALLKRPFLTLKADGPFIYDQAVVNAMVADRLAALGDPPIRLRLELVRFQLEGIDTGWKVVSARRVLPKPKEEAGKGQPAPSVSPGSENAAPEQTPRSPGDVSNGP